MASNESCVLTVDQNMQMSRGDEPEYHIDFSLIENLVVFDEQGQKIAVGDIYKQQKTILIFVRHFLCFVCKEYVDDLALIPDKYLEESNVQLVVIGCSEPKFIKSFRIATGYNQKLYVDPERKLYKALGCKEKLNLKHALKESKHVKSGFVSGFFQSMWRGLQYREFQGDVSQQGGAFIIGPGNRVDFVHHDNAAIDHTPINDLLHIAGVPLVNFEKDKRVLSM